jgi:flagellin
MPVITTKTPANSALQYRSANPMAQSSSLTKLASGSRTARALDDAISSSFGKAYDVQLSSDINASEASSTLQVADGGLADATDILHKMETLATWSASGPFADFQRQGSLQEQIDQLTKDLTSIAEGTRYGGQSLLTNSDTRSFNVGANQTVSFAFADVSAAGLSVDKLDVSSRQSAEEALKSINSAIDRISGLRSYVGAKRGELDSLRESTPTTMGNTAATNPASGNAVTSSPKVKQQAATAQLTQANQMPQNILNILG